MDLYKEHRCAVCNIIEIMKYAGYSVLQCRRTEISKAQQTINLKNTMTWRMPT